MDATVAVVGRGCPTPLVVGDDDADTELALSRQRRADGVVQICHVQELTSLYRFAGAAFGGDVDAGSGEAKGVGIVSALSDNRANEGREGVAGDAEPVGPSGT